MKALILWQLNEPLVFDEFPEPMLNGDEVIVELKAAALNRRDFWITIGMYPGIVFPTVLGSDGAGFCEGKEVLIYPAAGWGANSTFQSDGFSILGMPDHGCFAERVAVSRNAIFEKPKHLNWYQAAALPLAGLTAYRCLFSRAQLQKSDRVLISGIGGGVALLACQFALANGNEVFVTSGNDEKILKAKEIGASGGVNYHADHFPKSLLEMSGGFDVVVDSAAGKGFSELVKMMNSGGRIVFYGGTTGKIESLNPQLIFWKQLSILGSTMGSPLEFESMLNFVNTHQIIPVVDEIFNLENGNQALQKMSRSEQFGKLVLNI
jgi:NADPH:quinone reductase-like Zn-dependent oxidoreductase